MIFFIKKKKEEKRGIIFEDQLDGEEESSTEIGLSGNRNVRASRSVFTSGGSTLVDFYWNTAKVGLSLLLSRNLYKFGG